MLIHLIKYFLSKSSKAATCPSMSNYSQIPLSIPAPGKFGGLDGTQSSNTVTENMMDKSFDDERRNFFE